MSDNLGRQFVDTNVLVYAHDISAGIKHETARDLIINLWSSRQGCISLQVLQEFYVTIVQRVVKPIAPETASRIIADLGQWPLHLPDVKESGGCSCLVLEFSLHWERQVGKNFREVHSAFTEGATPYSC